MTTVSETGTKTSTKQRFRQPADYRQLKAARTVLDLTIHEVASLLNMGNSTIVKLESPDGAATANASTVRSLELFYQARGIGFTENGAAYGVTSRGIFWKEGR